MSCPEILYHYTNAQGLMGILTPQSNNTQLNLWATSYRYLNDSLELEHGFDLIKRIYPRQQATYAPDNLENHVFAECIHNQKFSFKNDCLFVTSFSEDKDLLSQWRAYAGPHSGYSIGIDSKALEAINEARFCKCSYDIEEQVRVLKEYLDGVFPELRDLWCKWQQENDHAHYYLKLGEAVVKASRLAATYKHPAFHEEKEWRLINDSPEKLLYRATATGITPYVELSINITPMPIKEIVVGPGPHQERNAETLRKFVSAQLSEDIEIVTSTIPYRNW